MVWWWCGSVLLLCFIKSYRNMLTPLRFRVCVCMGCSNEAHRLTEKHIYGMLERNQGIKAKPQKWQNTRNVCFDVVMCFDDKVYDMVVDSTFNGQCCACSSLPHAQFVARSVPWLLCGRLQTYRRASLATLLPSTLSTFPPETHTKLRKLLLPSPPPLLRR